jgi:hypothetical protein
MLITYMLLKYMRVAYSFFFINNNLKIIYFFSYFCFYLREFAEKNACDFSLCIKKAA